MLTFLLSAVLSFFAPAPQEAGGAEDPSIFLSADAVFTGGGTTIVQVGLDFYVFQTLDLPALMFENPSKLVLDYESAVGTIHVETPCKGMSEAQCAQRFKKQIEETQALLPRLKAEKSVEK